jgi:hypothetical protein
MTALALKEASRRAAGLSDLAPPPRSPIALEDDPEADLALDALVGGATPAPEPFAARGFAEPHSDLDGPSTKLTSGLDEPTHDGVGDALSVPTPPESKRRSGPPALPPSVPPARPSALDDLDALIADRAPKVEELNDGDVMDLDEADLVTSIGRSPMATDPSEDDVIIADDFDDVEMVDDEDRPRR